MTKILLFLIAGLIFYSCNNIYNIPNDNDIETIPTAPNYLIAETISSTQIELTWDDNSDNEIEFIVEQKKEADGTYNEICRVKENETTIIIENLVFGDTYYFRMYASNNAGNSDYSNEDSVTVNKHIITNFFVGALSVNSSDIDSDGDIDILGFEPVFDNIIWLENGGSGIFIKHIITQNSNGP